jgi:hypothetical protein
MSADFQLRPVLRPWQWASPWSELSIKSSFLDMSFWLREEET